MNNNDKKLYTPEEIKKTAPGYRGKPERFDPAKVGKKSVGAPKPKAGPASAEIPQPTRFDPAKVGKKSGGAPKPKAGPASVEIPQPTALDKAKKPITPVNAPMWSNFVFDVDVAVRDLNVNQEITPSFARLADSDNLFGAIAADFKKNELF